MLIRAIAWLGSGLILGLGLGLLLGWVAWPTEFTEADPTILEGSYQRDYTLMIAAAYSADGNLELARRRLSSLGKEDSGAWLLSVAVDHVLEGRSPEDSHRLAMLAADLGLTAPVLEPFVPDASVGDED